MSRASPSRRPRDPAREPGAARPCPDDRHGLWLACNAPYLVAEPIPLGTSATPDALALSAQSAELERLVRVGWPHEVRARPDVVDGQAESTRRALEAKVGEMTG